MCATGKKEIARYQCLLILIATEEAYFNRRAFTLFELPVKRRIAHVVEAQRHIAILHSELC